MGILSAVNGLLADLGSLFFPRTCEVCQKSLVQGEELICLECLYNLPRCNIHNDPFNIIHQRLMRHVPIEKAAAFYYYVRNSPYTEPILSAKYRSRPIILKKLAIMFAKEIIADGFFDSIDMIMPVPMHRWKRIKRGFNQTDFIAGGISEATGLPIGNNLVATRNHSTQTHKGAYGRWLNAQSIYEIDKPEEIDGKHILIVDDVITTGATMSSCCETVHKAAPSSRISVLSIGVTILQ